jgi:hypothetical protein
MGLFDKLDRLANAGAGSRMAEHEHGWAKRQGKTTNQRNHLAEVANGFGVSRAARNAAYAQLVAEVGEAEANLLAEQAVRRVRGTF